jgi:hypothetical protein
MRVSPGFGALLVVWLIRDVVHSCGTPEPWHFETPDTLEILALLPAHITRRVVFAFLNLWDLCSVAATLFIS